MTSGYAGTDVVSASGLRRLAVGHERTLQLCDQRDSLLDRTSPRSGRTVPGEQEDHLSEAFVFEQLLKWISSQGLRDACFLLGDAGRSPVVDGGFMEFGGG